MQVTAMKTQILEDFKVLLEGEFWPSETIYYSSGSWFIVIPNCFGYGIKYKYAKMPIVKRNMLENNKQYSHSTCKS